MEKHLINIPTADNFWFCSNTPILAFKKANPYKLLIIAPGLLRNKIYVAFLLKYITVQSRCRFVCLMIDV